MNLEEAICGVRPAEEEDYRLWTDVWELGGVQVDRSPHVLRDCLVDSLSELEKGQKADSKVGSLLNLYPSIIQMSYPLSSEEQNRLEKMFYLKKKREYILIWKKFQLGSVTFLQVTSWQDFSCPEKLIHNKPALIANGQPLSDIVLTVCHRPYGHLRSSRRSPILEEPLLSLLLMSAEFREFKQHMEDCTANAQYSRIA